MHIEIVTMTPVNDGSPKRAACGIRMSPAQNTPGILIQGIHVVEGTQGRAPFVSWPTWREGQALDSPRFPIVKVEADQIRWRAEFKILEAYMDMIRNPEPSDG